MLIIPLIHHSLRILALEKLGAVFNQVAFPLQYTPRKFVIHPETNNLILIETDHNAYTEATKAQRKQQMAEVSETGLHRAVLKKQRFCCLSPLEFCLISVCRFLFRSCLTHALIFPI